MRRDSSAAVTMGAILFGTVALFGPGGVHGIQHWGSSIAGESPASPASEEESAPSVGAAADEGARPATEMGSTGEQGADAPAAGGDVLAQNDTDGSSVRGEMPEIIVDDTERLPVTEEPLPPLPYEVEESFVRAWNEGLRAAEEQAAAAEARAPAAEEADEQAPEEVVEEQAVPSVTEATRRLARRAGQEMARGFVEVLTEELTPRVEEPLEPYQEDITQAFPTPEELEQMEAERALQSQVTAMNTAAAVTWSVQQGLAPFLATVAQAPARTRAQAADPTRTTPPFQGLPPTSQTEPMGPTPPAVATDPLGSMVPGTVTPGSLVPLPGLPGAGMAPRRTPVPAPITPPPAAVPPGTGTVPPIDITPPTPGMSPPVTW